MSHARFVSFLSVSADESSKGCHKSHKDRSQSNSEENYEDQNKESLSRADLRRPLMEKEAK